MSANNLAAAELFGLLSAFWQPPDESFWNNLADGSVDAEISKFAAQANFTNWQPSAPTFQEKLPELSAIQFFYLRCFIGIGKQSVLPVESIYKKWTADPSVRLPIAGSTGYLMGDSALHVQYLLDQYGLGVPPDYRMMPDHLVLLLELFAVLLEKRPSQEAQLFLSQHLDWLTPFEQAIDAVSPESTADSQAKDFYQLAAQTLHQAVNCQLAKYR
jgi:TorA maturation chaperone TorD